MVMCPHCRARQIFAAKVPKDVVVVMPCPACQELVVLFRNKVIAVSRKILKDGTRDEQKAHLADIVGEFLDAGVLNAQGMGSFGMPDDDMDIDSDLEEAEAVPVPPPPTPISREEIDRFVQIDLRRLDDPAYFKKHFS